MEKTSYTLGKVQEKPPAILAHRREHRINSPTDHTSNIPQGEVLDSDLYGLPHDSGILTTAVIASLGVTQSMRVGRVFLPAGVPVTVVFQINHIPAPLTAGWILFGSPYTINDRPSKVDPLITNRTASGFTAEVYRDSIMEYTAIDSIDLLNYSLREDGGICLREDGTYELEEI
jgi:hypothetical protein